MYELWHLGIAYVIGTAVGIGIFRHTIKEHLIVQALDTLVEQDYVRSYVDNEGVTQLKKWYEPEEEQTDLEKLEEMSADEIEAILEELIREEKRRKEDDAS